MRRRVVITGAGVVSPLGVGLDEFWRRCLDADSPVAPIPSHWQRYANYHSRIWAPLPELNPESFGITRVERLRFDPVTVLAIGAARDALRHARLVLKSDSGQATGSETVGVAADRIGIYLGTGLGGGFSFLQNHTHHLLQRVRSALKAYTEANAPPDHRATLAGILELMSHGLRFNPFEVSMVMPNAPAAVLGIRYGFVGPNETYCVACASGTVAVGNAWRAVRAGRADVAITGGCEYFGDEHGHIFRSFDVAGTLVRDCTDPERANRPFDKKRSGFLFSQGGAGILVLEELEHAMRRGAKPIAEIVGFAETFDAHSIMALAPGGEQIERMIRLALAEAGVGPEEVDYINAHGTGTQNNDAIEAEVIERVFGRRPLVNSTKSLLGHTIGASGAFEAIVTALSLRDGTTHVCKNLEDPVRELNFVRKVARHDLRIGLSQSFAFGGHNAALVLRRFERIG
jgi:3-oxoacyl-[acyl-carrier-protein] synthase II